MLYVHIPFCVHKCHYCDFNSHERAAPDWEGYRQALIAELSHWCAHPRFAGRPLASIFIGGGTPSLAPPTLIAAVIDAASTSAGFLPGIEITMEANPGTVDMSNFTGFRAAGVNRLSMGVQSLDAGELQWLERIHSAEDVGKAFKAARAAGFNNINLDLIYGLPKQTMAQWLSSLDSAIAMAPEHLSCYQLTVEPHTKLAAREASTPSAMPDEELAIAMFETSRKQLSAAGFEAYEISNFAKPGHHCRHNDGYWRYFDYIGIGAGAAGKFDLPDGGIERYANLRTPERYIDAACNSANAINSREHLPRNEAAAEAVWLGLRRSNGIDREAFRNRFAVDAWEIFADLLQPWLKQEMLIVDEKNIRLSHSGLVMADAIAESVI